jgi:hypothetical protein
MYLNFVNNKLVDGPRGLPNCYECISNFDCLEKNDPEALKDLSSILDKDGLIAKRFAF